MAMALTKGGFQKKYYISGYQLNQARRVCEFFFGDYFINIKLNQKEQRFDIKLKKTLNIGGKDVPVGEFLDLVDFKEYWGPQWRLVYEINEVI